MPSSSLVEVEFEVGVEVEVEVGDEVGVMQNANAMNEQIRSNFTFSVGWGGWLEKVRIKLNSTQVVVEAKVRVELGNCCWWIGTRLGPQSLF